MSKFHIQAAYQKVMVGTDLGIVAGAAVHDLGRHVDGRAHPRLGRGVHLVLGVAKVADLEQRPLAVAAVLVQQQVLQLQVPVRDPLGTVQGVASLLPCIIFIFMYVCICNVMIMYHVMYVCCFKKAFSSTE